ncbi:MAG: RNA polymerase sigma factor [Phycisphaerales bacterium JB039]
MTATVTKRAAEVEAPASIFSALTDEQLAARAQDGSRDAFAEIVRRYYPRLRSFMLRRTGNLADAEDAAQDGLLRAWQRIYTYQRGRPLRPWLFTIAARQGAQTMQRHSQQLQRLRDAAPDHQRRAAEANRAAQPLRLINERDDFGEAWRIAERLLSRDQLSCLWLRYVENMEPRQISQALGKSGVAVRVSLLRARATIAEELRRQRDEHASETSEIKP